MRLDTIFTLLALVAIAGCSSGTSNQRLLSGTLTGEYADRPFDLGFGFATFFRQEEFFSFSVASLDCTPAVQDELPTSTSATFVLPSLDVGSYTQVVVIIYDQATGFMSLGSNEGNVTISAVTDTSVAGSIDYTHVDPYGQTYAVTGTFDVVQCESVQR